MGRRNRKTSGVAGSLKVNAAGPASSASNANPGGDNVGHGTKGRQLEKLADCLVLTVLAVDVVLLTPRVAFLSFLWCGPPPLPPNALGGVLAACSMLLLLFYFLVAMAVRPAKSGWIKLSIIVAFAVFYLALPAISDMTARVKLGIQSGGRYVSFPHDGGVLQTEAATSFLLAGENPYSAYYGNTIMIQSHHSNPRLWESLGFKENPSFTYFSYPPLTFLLSAPVHVAWKGVFGWFDQRIIYLAALVVLGVFGYRLPRSNIFRLPLLALLIVNPVIAMFFVEGCNDILCITFMILTIYALSRNSLTYGSLFLGLACGVKQFAWIMIPFFLAYLIGHARRDLGQPKRLLVVLRPSWPLWTVIVAIFLPFLIWNPAALFHSLIVSNGSIYPFRPESLGVSNILICFKWVTTPRQQFPNFLFYIIFVLPMLVCGLWWTLRRNSLSAMLTAYVATLFLFLYFSRFFAHNYLWVILVVTACALLVDEDMPITKNASSTIGRT